MSTTGQKHYNYRVEDDNTSNFSEHSGGMLVQIVQDVVSSDYEVTEKVS